MTPLEPAGTETSEDDSPAVEANCRKGGVLRRINLLLLVVAAILLFLMLRGIDWPGLIGSLRQVGRYWPLLVVPYGVTCYCWSLSWRFLLVSEVNRPSMRRLFLVRLAGESLNQLTPTASLGGEPFKALLLKEQGVAWQEAAASLVIHKALMVISLVLYVFVSLWVVPLAVPVMPHRLAWFSTAGTLLLGTAGLVFLVVQRRSPCLSLLKVLEKFGICPAVLHARREELATLDSTLAAFYREHPGAGLLSLFFFFLGWLVHAFEVWMIFWLLGHPVGFGVALCLDALSQLFAGLGFMVPAALGVQDGGNILLSLGFNLGATLGAGFSILRRFREAFWLLLGLIVVAREK